MLSSKPPHGSVFVFLVPPDADILADGGAALLYKFTSCTATTRLHSDTDTHHSLRSRWNRAEKNRKAGGKGTKQEKRKKERNRQEKRKKMK